MLTVHIAQFNLTIHPHMHQVDLLQVNTRLKSVAMYAAAWDTIVRGVAKGCCILILLSEYALSKFLTRLELHCQYRTKSR